MLCEHPSRPHGRVTHLTRAKHHTSPLNTNKERALTHTHAYTLTDRGERCLVAVQLSLQTVFYDTAFEWIRVLTDSMRVRRVMVVVLARRVTTARPHAMQPALGPSGTWGPSSLL